VSAVEISLRSCVDGMGAAHVLDSEGKPYLNTDTVHLKNMRCLGRGEVLIRGPAVASGYYMNAKQSSEDFDEEGWFHTGDIGVWTVDGQLKIVDRLKNLVKLRSGEYVAIESMEATYGQSEFVNGLNGGIMCCADEEMDRPVALVQVNGAELKKWADTEGVQYEDLGDLCKNRKAVAMVTNHLNEIGDQLLHLFLSFCGTFVLSRQMICYLIYFCWHHCKHFRQRAPFMERVAIVRSTSTRHR